MNALDKILTGVREHNPEIESMGGHPNQPTMTLSFGKAFVTVDHDPTSNLFGLKGRREGGGGDWRNLPLGYHTDDPEKAVEWALEVLNTGRTCEVGKGVGLRQLRAWPHDQGIDFRLDTIVDMVEGDHHWESFNLNPDYQRSHVWANDQASKFVGFLIEGGQPPLIFLQRYDTDKNAPKGSEYWNLPIEVIDGQQRIRAIYGWMKDQYPATLTDGREIWFHDTDEIDRRCLPHIRVAFVDISREERLKFYLSLNRGGTIHTDAEINRVRDLLDKEKSTPE